MLHSSIRPKTIGLAPRPIDDLKDKFHNLLTKLEKNQVEYDLGCESIIKNYGSVKGNQFVVGSRNYDLVVLPPFFDNLMDSTYQLLLDYLQNGGKVLSMSEIPERVDGNRSKSMVEAFGKYSDQWIMVDEIDQNIFETYFYSTDFKPLNPEAWGGNVFHHRRILQDGQLNFFTNYDKEEIAQISFDGVGKSVLEFDLLSGEYRLIDAEEIEGMITLNFSLPPSGSKLLYFSEDHESGDKISLDSKFESHKIETSKTQIKRLQPNTLTLDYCDLKIDGNSYRDMYICNAADTIYKVYLKEPYGTNYNPWSNAVQYRTRILDKNEFNESTGFEVSYHFMIEEDFNPSVLNAVVEWPHFYEVKINGEKISSKPDEWWLDKSFGVFDLASQLKAGKNTLSLTASPMDILAEVELVYLVGDFGVKAMEKGWLLTPEKELQLGSWKEQQRPFYSHSISYAKTFLNSSKEKVRVKLNDWAGTVAEVKVNGQSAGIIGWAPYERDITDLLNDGENRVEVIVTGSMKNLLGPHHFNPLRGFVTPWSFFRGPANQPAGSEYDMIDYGLFEDFEVVVY